MSEIGLTAECYFLCLLAMLAVVDHLEKSVPRGMTVAAVALSAAGLVPGIDLSRAFAIGGSLILVILCYCSGKISSQLGRADAWLLLGTALALPSAAFFPGLLACAVCLGVTALCLFVGTKERGREIPFLPFLFSGMMFGAIGEAAIW